MTERTSKAGIMLVVGGEIKTRVMNIDRSIEGFDLECGFTFYYYFEEKRGRRHRHSDGNNEEAE